MSGTVYKKHLLTITVEHASGKKVSTETSTIYRGWKDIAQKAFVNALDELFLPDERIAFFDEQIEELKAQRNLLLKSCQKNVS